MGVCVPRKSANKNIYFIDSPDQLKITPELFIIQKKENPSLNYRIIGYLGEGSFGKVYSVEHNELKIKRAMKIIPIKPKNSYQFINKEIKILKSLDHPNIIKVYEFYLTKTSLSIICELCEGGDLYEKLKSEKKFREKTTFCIMKQLLSAVNYCHKNKVIHRDLKLENILIDKKDSFPDINIKLIDFGAGEILKKTNTTTSGTIGSLYYIAPEILNNSSYNEKCDLWSCGVIMYSLLCGEPPFYSRNKEKLYEKVKQGSFVFKKKIWGSISFEAKDLIRKLLTKNINKRISAEEALQHDWFKMCCTKSTITQFSTKISVSNIIKFKAEKKLQQIVLGFLVHNISELDNIKNNLKDVQQCFDFFDCKQQGRLQKKELNTQIKKVCKKCKNLKLERSLTTILDNIDMDKNGYIEYEEFIRASIDKKKLFSGENLKFAFESFDKNKKGFITIEDIKNSLVGAKKLYTDINSRLWDELICEGDFNGDGVISFEEFCTLMKN